MANIRVHPDRVEVHLTAAERVLGVHGPDVIIPRELIRSATVTHDPWVWIRGIRAPGISIPLTLAVGTWKNHGGRDFLVVKAKRPAVVLELDTDERNPYSRVLLSTNRAADLIDSLKLDDGSSGKSARD
ncbi:MAG: hypothetical protein ACKOXM_04280 [Agromyces sp.]